MSVLELIEATLRGQPPVFVERCDLPGILAAIELYGISDVDGLRIVLNDAERRENSNITKKNSEGGGW